MTQYSVGANDFSAINSDFYNLSTFSCVSCFFFFSICLFMQIVCLNFCFYYRWTGLISFFPGVILDSGNKIDRNKNRIQKSRSKFDRKMCFEVALSESSWVTYVAVWTNCFEEKKSRISRRNKVAFLVVFWCFSLFFIGKVWQIGNLAWLSSGYF